MQRFKNADWCLAKCRDMIMGRTPFLHYGQALGGKKVQIIDNNFAWFYNLFLKFVLQRILKLIWKYIIEIYHV